MKTLLLPFFDDDASQAALDQALMIARRYHSHIEGMPVVPRPQIIDSGGIAMVATATTELEEESATMAERARSRFLATLTAQGVRVDESSNDTENVTASWRDFSNEATPYLGDEGRLYDMIIIGRGFGHHWTNWSAICESALFECGRPVLVTAGTANSIGEHVAIAWNGSTETARTIGLSMPILNRASKVTLMTLEGWAVPGPSGEQLRHNLVRSGIDASLVAIDADGRMPGQAIVEQAIEVGADTLIKGAYTHSRLRQFVFGGATRHILHEAPLPVIMAH